MRGIITNTLASFYLILFFAASCWASPFEWTISTLGTWSAMDINNSGQIVGEANGHAVIWNNGTMTDMGTLGGGNNIGNPDFSYATDINNSGHVLGNSTGYSSFPGEQSPFMWVDGVMTPLSTFGAGARGFSINDYKQAVGFSTAEGSAWSYGVNIDSSRAGFMMAFDVNNSGQVVGSGWGGAALLSYNESVTVLNPMTAAFSINDRSQVAGTTADGQAAVWDNGMLTIIGPTYNIYGNLTKLLEINNAGQVVGPVLMNNNSPYFWDNGAGIDLNSLVDGTGWIINSAQSINDWGQIVGYGTISGRQEAFLLSPAAPVPEPSTAVLLLVTGLLGYCFFIRRRKNAS